MPRIRMRVAADTSIKPDTVFPRSRTPASDATLQSLYSYYKIVGAGALPIPQSGRVAIGGLSGARTYLRFDIPPNVLDSVQVIRASLLLTQNKARSIGAFVDTLTVFTQPVLASPTI